MILPTAVFADGLSSVVLFASSLMLFNILSENEKNKGAYRIEIYTKLSAKFSSGIIYC